MAKVVLSLSGGMDSGTLFAKALNDEHEVFPVHFHYPSKHNAYEYAAASHFIGYYRSVINDVLFLNSLHNFKLGFFEGFRSNLLQGQGDIPEGHYEAESMSQTVVPGRNMIFASILAGYAESIGAQEVWLGVHAGDHAIYPDCRPAFISSMRMAISDATGEKVGLKAPFLYHNKTRILQEGIQLNVPYQYTRTCYKDQPIACGKCGSCQERLEAFRNIGMEDPIEYESREILPK